MSRARPRVGVLAVPWVGVPPAGTGSVSRVVHELSRATADRLDLRIVSGPGRRSPGAELPGVIYNQLSDPVEEKVARRLRRGLARVGVGSDPHPYHSRWFSAWYALQAGRWFAAQRCQVVIVEEFPQWLPLVGRALPGVPLVLHAHSMFVLGGPDRLLSACRSADGIITVSDYLRRGFERRLPSLAGRIATVRNGVDVEEFRPDPCRPREPATVAYVGRVTPEKGIHVLVDAIARLAPARPDLRLVVAGPAGSSDPRLWGSIGVDPARSAELMALRTHYPRRLGERAGPFAERVEVVGPLAQQDVIDLLRRCTVLVQPSVCAEGFGLAPAEALACGAPVIVTDLGALPEVVAAGRLGKVVPAGDSGALAAALADVIDRPARPAVFDDAGAADFRAGASWETSGDALVAALGTLT